MLATKKKSGPERGRSRPKAVAVPDRDSLRAADSQPVVSASPPESSSAQLEHEAQKLLAERYAPPSVLLNRDLNVVRTWGDVTPYLAHVHAGLATNVMTVLRLDLRAPFQAALELARKGGPVVKEVPASGVASHRPLCLQVLPMQKGEAGFLAVFGGQSGGQTNNEQRLRELISDLERFSYSITHDLRAPLRAMQGFAAVLEQRCGATLAPQHLDWLRRIHISAERMDQLIQDALQYSRLMRADFPIQTVEIAGLLKKLIRAYPNLQAPATEIEVSFHRLEVKGNESALTQCFSNLLGNAVKFVTPGAVPRVCIRAEDHGTRVRIWVEDNGIGIPHEAQARIFEMFQRLHSESAYSGTGVGLAIVRKAMQRIGGGVGVESEPGKGSRFWIELAKA